MMIGVVVRVENRQREPLEGRQPVAAAYAFPKKLAPPNVVIAVPVPAADGAGAELKERHQHNDGDKPKDQINRARGLIGLQVFTQRRSCLCFWKGTDSGVGRLL